METLPIKNLKSGPHSPDIEIIVFPLAITNHGMGVAPPGNYALSLVRILGSVHLSICAHFLPFLTLHAIDNDVIDNISQGPVILKPASRGYIALRSADPYDHPIIDPRCSFYLLPSFWRAPVLKCTLSYHQVHLGRE